MSLYNLHYLEFMATSHDKFWSHPWPTASLNWRRVLGTLGLSPLRKEPHDEINQRYANRKKPAHQLCR